MRSTSLLCAAILTAVLATAQTAKPVSAFDQQLIEQQKHFLQDLENKDQSAVERAVAEDFQGIETNGDLYDKSEVVESVREGMPKDTLAYDFHVVKLTRDSAVVAYNLVVPGNIHGIGTWPTHGPRRTVDGS